MHMKQLLVHVLNICLHRASISEKPLVKVSYELHIDNVPRVLCLALATLAVIILPAYLVQSERALAILLLRIVDATVFASCVCP